MKGGAPGDVAPEQSEGCLYPDRGHQGPGDLGLDPRKCPRPSVIIIADRITLYPQEFYENGLRLITVPTRRNLAETVNPMIKP